MSKFVYAAAAAVVLIAGLPLDASASGRCGDKEGEARVAGVGPDATRAATRAAITDWKHNVYQKCGIYARWLTALDRDIRCEVKRGDVTECEVEATPIL